MSLQRRQKQEEMKEKKEAEHQERREAEKCKEEEKLRKKEEQVARRAAILEQHKLKKALEEAEREVNINVIYLFLIIKFNCYLESSFVIKKSLQF